MYNNLLGGRLVNYLFIGIGGIFGALARYAIGKWIAERWQSSFPLGTFFINLAGAFALGILVTFFAKFLPAYSNLKVMTTTGFLGAFTTFSTYTYESLRLIENGQYYQAFKYVVLSTILGIVLAYLAVLMIENI